MNYGTMYVNENYSKIVEPNLYFDAILQPGKTYNDQFQGDANSGLVKVYKLNADGVQDPKTPASDFEHTEAANELVDVRLNNAQRKSKKIYKIQANSVPFAMADSYLSIAVTDCKEGWQASGLACLAHEGTVLSDTSEITKENIKKKVIEARKAARKGKAVPSIVMASVDVYSTMLEAAGDQYTPVTNDAMMTTGQVGKWLGMLWVECNQMILPTAKYYDYAGTLQTEDLSKIDFIMYDWRAFSVVDNLEEIRIVDSENFVGSLAQVEINTGYRVTTKEKVIIRKHMEVPELKELSVTTAEGSSTGTTAVTVTPELAAGNSYKYKLAANPTLPEAGQECKTGYTVWDGSADITAAAGQKIVVVEVDAANRCVGAGIAAVTIKA